MGTQHFNGTHEYGLDLFFYLLLLLDPGADATGAHLSTSHLKYMLKLWALFLVTDQSILLLEAEREREIIYA